MKRVCRSTLAAESNGLAAAIAAADYQRPVILAPYRPFANLSALLDRGDLIQEKAYTDAKSLYDAGNRDTSRPYVFWLLSLVRCSMRREPVLCGLTTA